MVGYVITARSQPQHQRQNAVRAQTTITHVSDVKSVAATLAPNFNDSTAIPTCYDLPRKLPFKPQAVILTDSVTFTTMLKCARNRFLFPATWLFHGNGLPPCLVRVAHGLNQWI